MDVMISALAIVVGLNAWAMFGSMVLYLTVKELSIETLAEHIYIILFWPTILLVAVLFDSEDGVRTGSDVKSVLQKLIQIDKLVQKLIKSTVSESDPLETRRYARELAPHWEELMEESAKVCRDAGC